MYMYSVLEGALNPLIKIFVSDTKLRGSHRFGLLIEAIGIWSVGMQTSSLLTYIIHSILTVILTIAIPLYEHTGT